MDPCSGSLARLATQARRRLLRQLPDLSRIPDVPVAVPGERRWTRWLSSATTSAETTASSSPATLTTSSPRYTGCSATLRPRRATAGQQSWAADPAGPVPVAARPGRDGQGAARHPARTRRDIRDSLSASTCLPLLSRSCWRHGDIDAARQATAELAGIAAVYTTPGVQAELAAARGAVALSDGDPATALPLLRSAARCWREIDAPHAVATVSVLIGLACRAVGDEDAAEVELESARSTFARLGAHPDVHRVEELLHSTPASGPLSAREIEVLKLVAAGKTNHAIAAELFVSERTVHRHISNIFDKLGVHSRTAAASYAIQHHLVDVKIL